MEKNWKIINNSHFIYCLGETEFDLEYIPKKINGVYQNVWVLTGKVDNTTWHQHILESTHLGNAKKEVEKEIAEVVIQQMKYHLEISNNLAKMISQAIN